jgi:hypothetical protein
MNNTVRLISKYAKNGVVSLYVLKQKNYPIFKYFLNNYRLVLRQLKNSGIYVLNDLTTLNNKTKIKYFLLYYYGYCVNMTLLRVSDKTVYNYISKFGDPEDVVTSMGFEVMYSRKSTEEYIKSELYRLADSEGNIFKISDERLYSKLYYRARKMGVGIKDYIKHLGFNYRDVNVDEIMNLRAQGKSFNEISIILKVPRSTIHRLYKQKAVDIYDLQNKADQEQANRQRNDN